MSSSAGFVGGIGGPISTLKAYLNQNKASYFGFVSYMHFPGVFMLIAFAFFNYCSQIYFNGGLIVCNNPDKISENYAELACFMNGSYIIKNKTLDRDGGFNEEDKTYVSTHVWALSALVMVAIFSYGPHVLWKMNGNERVKTICKELLEPILDAAQSEEKVTQLFDYLVANIIGKNGWSPHQWTFVYFVCHIFQVMACFLYGWCINVFIEYYFLTYGYEYYLYYYDYYYLGKSTSENPLETVFPDFVRCTLKQFWQSGSRNDKELFCVLTCNILHRYVFLGLWYYFLLLLVLSLGDLSYLVMKWLSPNVRAARFMFPGVNDGEGIHNLCDKLRFADWLFLQSVRRQIDTVNFKKVIEKLIEHYSEIEEDSDDEN